MMFHWGIISMEQVQAVLKRIDNLRKKTPGSGNTDISVEGFHFDVGQQGKESIVNLEIDLTITPKKGNTSPT